MRSTISDKRLNVIPLSEPVISGNEWKYIKDCLDTGWVSSAGSYVTHFEEVIANYAGTKHAVSVVNGTAALHTGLIACGVQPNDEVIVPTLTFIAPVNAVKYCGAEPVFMDCDPETLCLDTIKLAEFIENNTTQKDDGFTYNKSTGRRIKAIIPVHIFGHPVDMSGLTNICTVHNIDIIEDAAESLGSEFKGEKTGSIGIMGCFSFNGNKIITTGGGGMIVTDNEILRRRARHLTTQAKRDPFEYDHDEIGYNYRLTNLQAAMGLAQIEKIEEFINIKRKNHELYKEILQEFEKVELLNEKQWAKSNFWLNTIKAPKKDKKPLMEYLLSRNIQVRPVWKLIHTLPMYKGCQTYAISNAIECYETCINLPSSAGLEQEEIEYVAESIVKYFEGL